LSVCLSVCLSGSDHYMPYEQLVQNQGSAKVSKLWRDKISLRYIFDGDCNMNGFVVIKLYNS